MPGDACLGTETLAAFIEGRAAPDVCSTIERHASRCAECRRLLSALGRAGDVASTVPARPLRAAEATPDTPDTPGTRDTPAMPDALDELAPGAAVARYVVRRRLGAGGMGVVYAAHDPELGRDVAIKLLAPGLGSSNARALLEERLRREARALAQLAHPNVVTVHDVGRVGDRLFLAMELIEGETLASWCRREHHAPRAILDHLCAAGRGLAAAHASGIVHRDVKLENMMLGRDGRVRVVDFGLARTSEAAPEVAGGEPVSGDLALTTPGAIMGTPSYMAPEQHRGEEVDARTDQFAFCVACYLALWDQHPFSGTDLLSLACAVEAGEVREPPRRRGVPRRIWRALRRGLLPDPAARFGTMGELLAALSPGRRGRWALAAGGLLLAATAAAGVALVLRPAGGPAPCTDMDAHLTGVWDPLRRAEVAVALRATGAPFAEASAITVTTRLDDFAARWARTRTEACTATRIRGEQTAGVMELRMNCLDDRLAELDALVDRLVHADRATADHAVAATYRLTDVSVCDELDLLRYRATPPRDPAQIAALRKQFAAIRALDATGRYQDGLAALAALAPAVRAADYRPLEAEAALLEGTLDYDADHADAAIAALERAVWDAEACAYDGVAAAALIQLIHVYGEHGKFAEADAAHARATAALERIGHAPELSADLDYTTGTVAFVRGDLDAAEASLQRAVHTAEGLHGQADLGLATTLVALGQLELQRENGRAEPYLERARQIEERLLGPDHPDLAVVQVALGGAAYERGAYDAAARHYERALAILDHTVGHHDAQVANALNDLALVRQWQGRAGEALAEVREAIAIDEKVLPAADPAAAAHLVTESDILEQLDRHREALAVNQRALAMLHALFGADHQDIADALHSRAMIELALGDLDPALADARAALAMFHRVNPAYPQLELLRTLGRIELARHDPTGALADFQRALRDPRPDTDPSDLAWLRGLMGRALIESGQDRAHGLALVTAAYRELRGDERAGEQARDLERWMRSAHIPVPAVEPSPRSPP